MIRFFRNIRKNLLLQGKLLSYFKYGIGEIILVMIGILLALQVNNWNENRKNRNYEQDLYQELILVLSGDLEHCLEKMDFIEESVKALEFFILNDRDSLIKHSGMKEINRQIEEAWSASSSFMPNRAYYNKLLNTNRLDLIQSEELKANIIKLYEHYYVRYNDLDLNIENQSVFGMQKNFYSKIIDHNIRHNEFKLEKEEFIKYYDVMIKEYREIYHLTDLTRGAMDNCKKQIELLLNELKNNQSN